MSQLKTYPEYKDSGVEWIGEIPIDWKVTKIKNVAFLRQQNMSTQILAKKSWYYYDIPTIQETGIGRIEKGKYIKSNKYLLEGDEILVSKLNPRKGTVVKVEKNNELSIICSTELIPLVSNTINSNFLYYTLKNSITADVFNSMVTSVTYSHQRINPKSIEDFLIGVPNLNTQKIISNYLDKKTSEIDNLISDKERLIELLEEKRQAVITETVTKGLDPNVEIKDSGIEWIGGIPEHWDVIKLNYITDLKNIKALPGTKLPYLGLENVSSKTGKIINFNKSSDVIGESILFSENDVLFGKLRPYLTKCVVAPRKGRCTSEFLVLKAKKQVFNNKYLQYLMLSDLFIETVNSSTYGAKMPRASWNFIRNIYLPLPQYKEQINIIEFIESSLKNIDDIHNKITIQISKLKKYRESLIYEAVTGKIDVRDYAVEQEEVY